MPEATIDENGVIDSGRWTLISGDLIYANPEVGYAAIMHASESDLDDLYAVLRKREELKHARSND